MRIKRVEIVPVKPCNGLVGFAYLFFEEGLFLGSIAIHKKLNGDGFRLTYPKKKIGDTDVTIFHPITKKCSSCFEEMIFETAARYL